MHDAFLGISPPASWANFSLYGLLLVVVPIPTFLAIKLLLTLRFAAIEKVRKYEVISSYETEDGIHVSLDLDPAHPAELKEQTKAPLFQRTKRR